jgi:HAMP domain-containing protein
MLYVFGGLLGRPMRLLNNAMRDFGQSDLDRRIAETRNDEFGQLFAAYNHMAEGIQARFAKDGGGAAPEPSMAMEHEQIETIGDSGADTEATLQTRSVRGRPSPEPAA